MSGAEIKKQIDINNEQIMALIQPSMTQFVLNDEVARLIAENVNLQRQCPHDFVNGACQYCGKEEAK